VIKHDVDVVEMDPEKRTVTDSKGQTYTGDVIIAADGAQGLGRKTLGGTPAIPGGYAYYRCVLM
jgi:2-polyprenyl-6-methoxyphenol hydroxylase-like FAD-dependent oxidoreductase